MRAAAKAVLQSAATRATPKIRFFFTSILPAGFQSVKYARRSSRNASRGTSIAEPRKHLFIPPKAQVPPHTLRVILSETNRGGKNPGDAAITYTARSFSHHSRPHAAMKGTGFSPYIPAAKRKAASAPEGILD
ncbi:hypothetical protein ACP_0211 [Acidobacterium capsulatum ATCC 51196]|uniref:Uncharacterized protein n=1 Tax=Acidobacterium capsulatum (strain ATCC 51196 / DSM 11244 / BCRC 80197 / JCM 7670 / NBRC 15755 / NCIMB 13165 / 161) TaxID=240015 RepID=C1F958_ACIC5|nr:hypothetical protein ACP_0211 [Acidobacterium capsulatum ATCC 51196]